MTFKFCPIHHQLTIKVYLYQGTITLLFSSSSFHFFFWKKNPPVEQYLSQDGRVMIKGTCNMIYSWTSGLICNICSVLKDVSGMFLKGQAAHSWKRWCISWITTWGPALCEQCLCLLLLAIPIYCEGGDTNISSALYNRETIMCDIILYELSTRERKRGNQNVRQRQKAYSENFEVFDSESTTLAFLFMVYVAVTIKASAMILGLTLLWIRMFTIRKKDKLFSWEQSSLKKMQLIYYICHPWSLQLHWTNDDKLKEWEQILSSCCLLSGFGISRCWQYRGIICLK